jgi:hypothetical protein
MPDHLTFHPGPPVVRGKAHRLSLQRLIHWRAFSIPMNTPPRKHERVPGVCMDPRVFYAAPRWYGRPTTRPLSDRAIVRYQRAGRYNRPPRLRDTAQGRLVWSA